MDIRNLEMKGGLPAEIVVHTVDANKRVQDYRRTFLPPQRLILLGGGYISHALCRYAADLGFEVTVVDDRPSFANEARFPEAACVICDEFAQAIQKLAVTAYDYVAVITRGHRHDSLCLRTIFAGTMPYYLGLIGSRRRTTEMFALLNEEGIDHELIRKVCTPIGIPIGAETTKEIAISILAELIQYRSRQNTERPAEQLVLTSNEPELLQYLCAKQEACVLAMVVEKSGSTPVPTGALMAVNGIGGTVGTVGGGCGEHEILLRALEVLRSGKAAMFMLNLTNDVAEEEGMVCGGRMKVWIEPFPAAELR